jgi:sulfur carrier protein ThiS
MKVMVKFIGMPEPLPGFEDKKEVQVDFSGNTVKDLLHHLSLRIGPKQKEIFLNDQGEISSMLFVCINGDFPLYSDRLNARLRDDDFVELIFASGG